jgi:hypothetical protein
LLTASNIQHHAIESIGLVLLDQELLIKSIGFDATSELEFVGLVLLHFEIAHSESQHLQLMGEVAEAQHEVEGLHNAVVGEGLRSFHRVHHHDRVSVKGTLRIVSHHLLVDIRIDVRAYEVIRILDDHLLTLLLLELGS